jgi:hypothetical protein
MKPILMALAAASALALPIAALAQTDAALTRAQVRAELEQLEQAGYYPGRGEDPGYPAAIQAAEARVSSRNDATGYGGAMSGASATGARAVMRPASAQEMKPIYFGGQ